MFTIHNLHYVYHDAGESYDFSLSLKEGEIAAILGQSGSGKSTLLDLIAGFITPQIGSISLEGVELSMLTVEQRPITILFQHHNLFEHLSVEKNILLGISKKLKSTQEELQKVRAILQEVALPDFGFRIVSTLSGGQQQRVALARALLRKKPILLLDEPFSGLDVDTKTQMLELVKKITLENRLYTIMVTHDPYDCDLIADKIYTVKDHKLFLS